MRKSISVLLAGAMLMMATSAMAVTVGAGGSFLESDGYTYYNNWAESVILTDTDGTDDSATAFLLLETAGYAGTNTFGIYGFNQVGSSVTLGNTLEVFTGPSAAITSITLAFDLAAGTVTNSSTLATALIGKNFGFYLTAGVNTFYTHAVLNADNLDHFALYDTRANKAGSLLGSDVVLGIEDLLGLGDNDFDDMVVGVTDVAPVPEPGTMLLLGIGMLGMAVYGKRRMNKQA